MLRHLRRNLRGVEAGANNSVRSEEKKIRERRVGVEAADGE